MHASLGVSLSVQPQKASALGCDRFITVSEGPELRRQRVSSIDMCHMPTWFHVAPILRVPARHVPFHTLTLVDDAHCRGSDATFVVMEDTETKINLTKPLIRNAAHCCFCRTTNGDYIPYIFGDLLLSSRSHLLYCIN